MSENKVRIIIDSAADFAQDVAEELTVIPMTLRFGDEEYIDGVTIDYKQFYQKLQSSSVLPTTSQIQPMTYADAFREAQAAGEDVVLICVSSKFSGTYQSANIAADEVGGNIYIVDSQSVAIGQGILAEYGLRLKKEGKSAAEIAQILSEAANKIRIIATVNTMEYLKKGGRVSSTVAFAGELLSIKPVLSVKHGEVSVVGKARGSRQGNSMLIKEIEAAGGIDYSKPLLLGFTGVEDSLLQKFTQDSADYWKGNVDVLPTAPIGSIIGTHAGPGAVAVAFFEK